MQRPIMTRRILVAAEMEDGSAVVYELSDVRQGSVSVTTNFDEPTCFGLNSIGGLPPLSFHELHAEGHFLQARYVPASDYFEDRPEIEPAQIALNP